MRPRISSRAPATVSAPATTRESSGPATAAGRARRSTRCSGPGSRRIVPSRTSGHCVSRPARCAASYRRRLANTRAIARMATCSGDTPRARTVRPRHLLVAQVHEHLGDVDLHRADLVAGAAQGRRVGQRAGRRHAAEHRREDRADRPGVHGAVGVAAGALVDRADVQAGRAADAVERLAPDRVGEHLGAAVVERARGGTRAARRRRSPRSTATCTGSSARRSRIAAAAGGRPRGPPTSGSPSRSP